MTAAAFAQDDLEFYCPGNLYLKHSGEARNWPYEYNRHIAAYQANDFTSSKSYHVVGTYNDFFGGYFKKEGYGFGHWSLYDEMPGQKLWLWSLGRDGGIWEDLLTDTDGQYIEFQAGRLFNQHFSGGHQNPVTQATFPPHATDEWTEQWFPVLDIGGMTDVSPQAVLHVEVVGDQLQLGINALTTSKGNLKVINDQTILFQDQLNLKPMEVYQKNLPLENKEGFSISLPEMGLYYTHRTDSLNIDRPFTQAPTSNTTDRLYQKGLEHYNVREYAEAEKLFLQVLNQDAHHLEALTALAEVNYRNGLYTEALAYASKGLQLDTYAPNTNFVAGLIYKAQKDWVNAKEAFGWAARSMAYRSAAYCLMAEIELLNNQLALAIHYANRSLDFNRLNLNAYKVLIISHRLRKDTDKVNSLIGKLSEIDPLNHFARYEEQLQQGLNLNFFGDYT